MRKRIIPVAVALAVCLSPASAQKKRAVASAKTAVAKVDKQKEEKLAQMTEATQKVMFVDSVVVDKDSFLSSYLLNPEAGRIGGYGSVFGTGAQPNAYVYVNELGDKSYFSLEDSVGGFALYTSDSFDGKWSAPRPLEGIDTKEKYDGINYPFMMADGTTLCFAAKGKESIGGYDIFVTRYDSESGSFLEPDNIGMPFNSTANDYMYAIDEYGDIGWFATDRNQEAGKVCVYMFIPTTVRQTYIGGGYTEAQIKSFARLDRIADTWGDGSEREEAIERIKSVPARLGRKDEDKAWSFVVNDGVTYSKWSDFKVGESKDKFIKLLDMKRKYAKLDAALDNARDYYAASSATERKKIASEIRQSEAQVETMEASIKELEKEIRNLENKAR